MKENINNYSLNNNFDFSKLKGRAKIQLINKDTGKIEYEKIEENMITNAVKNIMEPNFPIGKYSSYDMSDVYSGVSKLRRLYGGILLFSESLTENLNNIIPTASNYNNYIGCAGTAYAGASKFRGSLNNAESGEIENGYKFVWDFPTNAGNGSISAIALTSENGGNFGLYEDENDLQYLSFLEFPGKGQITENSLILQSNTVTGDVKMIQIDCNNFIELIKSTTNSITIKKINISNNINLNMNLWYPDKTVFEKEVVTEHVITHNFDEMYGMHYEQADDALYFCRVNYVNPNVSINVLKINLSDLSTVENTYTFNITVSLPSSISNVMYNNNKVYFVSGTNIFIYDISSNTYSNVTYTSNLKHIQGFIGDICYMYYESESNYTTVYLLVNNSIKLSKIKMNEYNGPSQFNLIKNCEPWASVLENSKVSGTQTYKCCQHLFSAYLASINNVSTFTKYNTQTLKITYELTTA